MTTELARRKPGSARISLFEDKGKPVEAIVRYGSDGSVRAIHAKVPVSVEARECWMMGGMENGQWVQRPQLTAVAFDKINAIMGVKIFKPPIICTDKDGPRPNPYIHRGPDNDIEYVQVRGVGVWRNTMGNLCCRDLTIVFDLRTYFAQDLWSRWTGKKKDEPKSWGKVFARGSAPKTSPTQLLVAMPNGVDLLVDLQDKEVLSLLGEQITRQKFADRIAQTVCHRLLIRKALGAIVPTRDASGGVCVPVTGWIEPDRDLEAIASASENMSEKIGQAYGEDVQIETESMIPDREDIVDTVASSVDDPQEAPEEPECDDEPPPEFEEPTEQLPEPPPEPAPAPKPTPRRKAPQTAPQTPSQPPQGEPTNLDILAERLAGQSGAELNKCQARIVRYCRTLHRCSPEELSKTAFENLVGQIEQGRIEVES